MKGVTSGSISNCSWSSSEQVSVIASSNWRYSLFSEISSITAPFISWPVEFDWSDGKIKRGDRGTEVWQAQWGERRASTTALCPSMIAPTCFCEADLFCAVPFLWHGALNIFPCEAVFEIYLTANWKEHSKNHGINHTITRSFAPLLFYLSPQRKTGNVACTGAILFYSLQWT